MSYQNREQGEKVAGERRTVDSCVKFVVLAHQYLRGNEAKITH